MADMEAEEPVKPKILEEDDEFEEFEAQEGDGLMEEIEVIKPWEEDWEDDVTEDNFVTTLKQEIASK